MKKNLSLFTLLLLQFLSIQTTYSQKYARKDLVFKIDFGSQANPASQYIGDLENYRQVSGVCPDDGQYSFASYTNSCFNGNWTVMNEDHTAGDYNGRMLIVNASHTPGIFFIYPVNNIKPNTHYEISAWIINVCYGSNGCTPTPPVVVFNIFSNKGNQLIKIQTPPITPMATPRWLRFYGEFTTPADVTGIEMRFTDEISGGCGNDFAIDDITLSELVPPEPPKEIAKTEKKEAVKAPTPPPPATKPKPKPTQASTMVTKEKTPVTVKKDVTQKPVNTQPVIKERNEKIDIPKILAVRSNPVVKTIETTESEIIVELYDNGEIDGDTVSIYHNNKLVVANAALSEKPIVLKIKVDKEQPHHELVMVANNLGSIPPNTSLMIVTANDKRYEVFISSNDQKNAKVLIELKE